jgi:hypothetical protein
LISLQGLRFIPLLVGAEKRLPEEIQQLLKTGRAWVVPHNSSQPKAKAWTDWHPSHGAAKSPEIAEETKAIPYFPEPIEKSFSFAELFAGIGGFRLGLEAVGGKCVFASEIERFTRSLYILNFGESPPVVGDIQEVKDSEIPEVWIGDETKCPKNHRSSFVFSAKCAKDMLNIAFLWGGVAV